MNGDLANPAHILVVDDEKSIGKLVSALLMSQGHYVRQAGGGEEALRLAGETPFDLVITDIRMQGMDGVALARELAMKDLRMKIIFMSGYYGKEEAYPEGFPGPWEFIAKPFTLPDMLAIVDRVLCGLVEK
jgi:two-component system response regulator AtoC